MGRGRSPNKGDLKRLAAALSERLSKGARVPLYFKGENWGCKWIFGTTSCIPDQPALDRIQGVLAGDMSQFGANRDIWIRYSERVLEAPGGKASLPDLAWLLWVAGKPSVRRSKKFGNNYLKDWHLDWEHAAELVPDALRKKLGPIDGRRSIFQLGAQLEEIGVAPIHLAIDQPGTTAEELTRREPQGRNREYLRHLQSTAALILQGPPGTGKTYSALRLIDSFVQAEPSVLETTRSRESYRWGKLREEGSEAWLTAPVVWDLVQLHPGYAYEDLVRGIGTRAEGNGVVFAPRDGILVELAMVAEQRARAKTTGPTILILDEINRCNLAAVLGELIFLLEKDKRGQEIIVQYPSPGPILGDSPDGLKVRPKGSRSFTLPPNLWILGTMNTADRSIALVDYAIRRRFRFLDVLPSEEVLVDLYKSHTMKDKVLGLFNRVSNLIEQHRLRIGHSYFMVSGEDSNDWRKRFADRVVYELVPLLREYHQERHLVSNASLLVLPNGGTIRLDKATNSALDEVNTVLSWLEAKANA